MTSVNTGEPILSEVCEIRVFLCWVEGQIGGQTDGWMSGCIDWVDEWVC